MYKMEIALFLVLALVALIYFTSDRRHTMLHQTFSVLLAAMIFHIAFDGITVYTVNHLDTVPVFLNALYHRIFIGSMILVVFLFSQYISILVAEEKGEKPGLGTFSLVFLAIAEIANLHLPVHYAITPDGNYSDGIHAITCYVAIAFYLAVSLIKLICNRKSIERKKRMVISTALFVELTCTILQAFNPTWLLSSLGLTLMTLSFYLTLENPAVLQAELVEQKLSMLYLRSQINPHFLYNTLDTIRIQAQLNGDKEVSDLLMRLVDFFRLSVKIDKQMVALDDELELLEAYMDLMCYRYPDLKCEYDIDPELECVLVPNFTLQPLVENSLLHGLKNKGYKGLLRISAHKTSDNSIEIEVYDNGSGFADGRKDVLDARLAAYDKQAPKLDGNSIGIMNVQKRIKYLFGNDYGLTYTENEEGGVTAHVLLPLRMSDSELSE